MWDLGNEYTPPSSPVVVAFQGRPRVETPELRKDRSSSYYKILPRRRAADYVETDEREHGWGSNAAAISQAATAETITRPAYASKPTEMSLQALIDPLDLESCSSPASRKSKSSRPRRSRFMRILYAICLCSNTTQGIPSTPKRKPSTSAKRLSESEVQQARRSREIFLEKRKARGSIMYEKATGMAQIPLYAAPATAEVSSAPALSSFAPRAPLKTVKDHRKSIQSLHNKPMIAQASATIDRDGNIVEVKKEKGFARGKGNRYSAFVQGKGITTSTEPLPPLPRSPLRAQVEAL